MNNSVVIYHIIQTVCRTHVLIAFNALENNSLIILLENISIIFLIKKIKYLVAA